MTGTAHELAAQIAGLREPFEQVMQDARRGVHRGATEAGRRPVTAKPAPTIEERLAALEELVAHPLMAIGMPPFTGEQEAELRKSLDALGQDGKPFEYRILPPGRLLTPELARELLRECVTVVKPGETLFIRVSESWTPNQIREYTDMLQAWLDHRDAGCHVVVGWGEEFAVAQPEPAAFMKEVREEAFRDEDVTGVRLTHLPTGVTAEGPTRDRAVGRLTEQLFVRGHISVNTARSAYGLPPFDGDFAERPLDVRR